MFVMAGLEFVDMMGDKLPCGKRHYSTHGYRAVSTTRDASFVTYAEGVSHLLIRAVIAIPRRYSERGNVRLGACLGGAALAHTGLSSVLLPSFFRFDVLV
jgi:hypothetical protein